MTISSRTSGIINRLPHFFQSEDPASKLYQLVSVFASQIDQAEEDLLGIMRTHWINTADDDVSPTAGSNAKGDLDKILDLFIQNLGGTSLLRPVFSSSDQAGKEAYDRYRERMKKLIRVILNGPSTPENLISIVAANLGIFGDDLAAVDALSQIRIDDFLPERQTCLYPGVLLLQRNLFFTNPNPEAAKVTITVNTPDNLNFSLTNPRIIQPGTGRSIQFTGTLLKNEQLIFLPGGDCLVNGVRMPTIQSPEAFRFDPGITEFTLNADVGYCQGTFGQTRFDYCLFEKEEITGLGVFDETCFDDSVFVTDDPVADISIAFEQLYPGSFAVVIPWDSPGFTVKFHLRSTLKARLNDFLDQFQGQQDILDALQSAMEIVNGFVDSNTVFDNAQDLMKAISRLDSGLQSSIFKIIVSEAEPVADMFDGMTIDPRRQIRYILEKVKAAGIYAKVTYEKRLTETLAVDDSMIMKGRMHPFTEEQDMQEQNFDIKSIQYPDSGGLKHEMSDNLILCGVFDSTRFDSLNVFA